MALIHKATLKPSKLELLTSWLPTQPWFHGDGDVKQVGAYRFDDPAGEVGIEAFLLEAADGSVVHVPLTYRGSPLSGAEAFLVGTTEHSVLGTRWVYDGCGDPVWATQTVRTILGGGVQADEFFRVDGVQQHREPTMRVQGSGAGGVEIAGIDVVSSRDHGPTTVVRAGAFEVVVVRVVGAEPPAVHALTGTWDGGGPALLAGLRQA